MGRKEVCGKKIVAVITGSNVSPVELVDLISSWNKAFVFVEMHISVYMITRFCIKYLSVLLLDDNSQVIITKRP